MPAVIDTILNTVTVTLPDGADLHNLSASFIVASQVNAAINNAQVSGSDAVINMTGICDNR